MRQGEWQAVPCYSACRPRESGDRIRRLIPAAYCGGPIGRKRPAAAIRPEKSTRRPAPFMTQCDRSINNTTWADCCVFLRSEKAGRRIAFPT
ncbi:conserved hypothetical protein [Burkholderia pseudomallei 576]|nr:conserved hypothetical protein [Burkholderia pseudomallei 576]